MMEVNLETVIGTLSLVQDSATQRIQSGPCKTQTSYETENSLSNCLERLHRLRVVNWQFDGIWESMWWFSMDPLHVDTTHRSETNGVAQRAVWRGKEGNSAVFLESGLDEKWWSESMECFAYLRNIQDLLSDGKTPYKRRFLETILRSDHSVWFNGWVLPYLSERPVKNPSIWKGLPGFLRSKLRVVFIFRFSFVLSEGEMLNQILTACEEVLFKCCWLKLSCFFAELFQDFNVRVMCILCGSSIMWRRAVHGEYSYDGTWCRIQRLYHQTKILPPSASCKT